MKNLQKHGRDILETEVTNISSHGLWILSDEKEFFSLLKIFHGSKTRQSVILLMLRVLGMDICIGKI